jgi:FdrA protein
MRQEAANPKVGMILLDVVLGEGSHPDPASELVPVIREIGNQRPGIEFVAILIGTDEDPQNIQAQMGQLQEANVTIFRSVTEAIEDISLRFNRQTAKEYPSVEVEKLKQPLAAINVGLESFYESLTSQGAQAVHVEWRPPAGGNERLAALLQKMKK